MKRRMLAVFVPVFLLASLAGSAFAAGPCNNDMVRNVDSSGNIIALSSGQIFKVFPGQNTRSIFWLPLDKVVVCQLGGQGYEITNIAKGEKYTQVKAIRTN